MGGLATLLKAKFGTGPTAPTRAGHGQGSQWMHLTESRLIRAVGSANPANMTAVSVPVKKECLHVPVFPLVCRLLSSRPGDHRTLVRAKPQKGVWRRFSERTFSGRARAAATGEAGASPERLTRAGAPLGNAPEHLGSTSRTRWGIIRRLR